MKRRVLSILFIFTFTIFLITGCGAKAKENSKYDSTSSGKSDPTSRDTSFSTSTEFGTFDSKDGSSGLIIGEKNSVLDTSDETKGMLIGDSLDDFDMGGEREASGEMSPDWASTSDTMIIDSPDLAMEPTDPEYYPDISAGLLTAGEWNDNYNWTFFRNLISNQQLILPSFGMNPINRITVSVVSEDGNPVKNANVQLLSDTGDIIWEAVSDYNGIAYMFFNVINNNQTPTSLRVSKNNFSTSANIELDEVVDEQNQNNQANTPYKNVTVTIEEEPSTKALDLMFVFDTTGSMGDELRYLQTEFEDIAKKVADQNTRFSVNFYRDEGDLYVVKSNEFNHDTDLVLEQLKKEYADGGGDYPEAVDQALYDGVFNHSWNGESIKLLFLILDAPPHNDSSQINSNLQKTIVEAAKQGIRIIPVASSGVDKDTETFLRTIAILTGGTYTFLTDHSGIGNSHIEPTIGSYQVESLNDCIVRIIKTYYK